MSGVAQSPPKWGVRPASAWRSIATGQQTFRIGSYVPLTEVAGPHSFTSSAAPAFLRAGLSGSGPLGAAAPHEQY